MTIQSGDCWTEQTHQLMVEETSQHLWRFLQKNATAREVRNEMFLKLAQLSNEDLQLLASLHVLLSNQTLEFLTEIAPAILTRLSKTSVHQNQQSRGFAKGRVQWGRTYVERAAKGGDPSLFVVGSRMNQFDVPQNRVLLYLIQDIYERLSEMEHNAWDSERMIHDERLKWKDQLGQLRHQVGSLLKNPYLPHIAKVQGVTEKHIDQTERTRGEWYSKLAAFARFYIGCFGDPLNYLQKQFPRTVLEPMNRDTLYELAVLFKVLETLDSLGWQEQTVNLIGNGNNIISVFEKAGTKLRVYYQGVPIKFDEVSKYKDIMKTYGLSNRSRRPDIVLEWIDEADVARYFIIEVKRSERRQYLVDGAYKLFGYLHDFEGAFADAGSVQAVLVGWSGIEVVQPDAAQTIHLTGWDRLKTTFEVVLAGKQQP